MTYLFQLPSPVTICIDDSPAKLRKGKVAKSKGRVKKSTASPVHKEHCIVLSSGESDSDEQVGFIDIHVKLLKAHVHQRASVCLSFCSRMVLSLNESSSGAENKVLVRCRFRFHLGVSCIRPINAHHF